MKGGGGPAPLPNAPNHTPARARVPRGGRRRGGRPVSEGEPKGERHVWDNSNIIESYGGVTTPLTFSFARAVYEDVYRQFCRLMGTSDALIASHQPGVPNT